MVDVWLPYGNTEVCVRVPTENLQKIIEPKEKQAIELETEMINALKNPIGKKNLTKNLKPDTRGRSTLALSSGQFLWPF